MIYVCQFHLLTFFRETGPRLKVQTAVGSLCVSYKIVTEVGHMLPVTGLAISYVLSVFPPSQATLTAFMTSELLADTTGITTNSMKATLPLLSSPKSK